MVSVSHCHSVRTNGEGWFRMHPPMHALHHLPNLVSHPTPRPISKPTPWRTWASKRAAFGQQRARAADPFVPAFSEADFGQRAGKPGYTGYTGNTMLCQVYSRYTVGIQGCIQVGGIQGYTGKPGTPTIFNQGYTGGIQFHLVGVSMVCAGGLSGMCCVPVPKSLKAI